MLEVHGHAITFYFFYTQDGEGDTGLTVTCNIRKKEADGTKTTLVTDGACTEWFGGLYYYTLATGSVASEGDYVGISHTDDANTDQKDLPAIWVIDKANLEDIGDILEDTGTTLPAVLDAIKGTGWTDEDLVAIKAAVDSVKTWTAANISSSVTSGAITQIRGNTWDFEIPDLTLDSNKQQFAIKETKLEADAQALLLIDTTTGLLYVNGAEVDVADHGKASLSYMGTTLTVTVDASITAQLPTAGNYHYGIQSVTAAGVVSESYGGTFTITADTVRATA
jgi:hypothetical protein